VKFGAIQILRKPESSEHMVNYSYVRINTHATPV